MLSKLVLSLEIVYISYFFFTFDCYIYVHIYIFGQYCHNWFSHFEKTTKFSTQWESHELWQLNMARKYFLASTYHHCSIFWLSNSYLIVKSWLPPIITVVTAGRACSTDSSRWIAALPGSVWSVDVYQSIISIDWWNIPQYHDQNMNYQMSKYQTTNTKANDVALVCWASKCWNTNTPEYQNTKIQHTKK